MIQSRRQRQGVYLAYPPFASGNTPYLSIPTLAAFLKSRAIPCWGDDLGVEFWHRYLTPERVDSSRQWLTERFLELNRQTRLSLGEALTYLLSSSMLETLSDGTVPWPFPAARAPLAWFQEHNLLSLLIPLTTLPFFPSFMEESPEKKLFSRYSPYSSRDLVASLDEETFYHEVLSEVIRERVARLPEPPRIVGLSLTFPIQAAPAFYCARELKRLLPDSFIVIGGAFVSVHLRQLGNPVLLDWVDGLIVDDGEIPLLELYRELGREQPDLARVPALIWKDAGHEIQRNPPRPPLSLTRMPPPDYSQMNLDKYFAPRREMNFSMRLSHGCYWQRCTFCRTELSFCKDYEQPPKELVFAWLCEVLEKTEAHRIFFVDESSRPDVLEFIAENLLRRGIEVDWQAHTRFHRSLTRERFALFRKSGCSGLSLGLESFSERILADMDMGFEPGLVDEVLAANAGRVPLSMYMIVGFPGETEAEARAGHRRLLALQERKLISGFYYSLFQLVFGSDIWRRPETYGITAIDHPPDMDLSPVIFDFSAAGMSRTRALELLLEFRGVLPFQNRNLMGLMLFNEITCNGKTVPLAFSFAQVRKFVAKYDFQLNFIPLGRLIETAAESLARRTGKT
jgi:radical SAM superfamily enzyme YgiQ (UPF0313 family)